MIVRIPLVLVFLILAAPHSLVAETSVTPNDEIARFHVLERAMQEAFQMHALQEEESPNHAKKTGGYSEFMQAEIQPTFRELYGTEFEDVELQSMTSKQLEARFKAFYIGGFFRQSDPITEHMLKIVDLLDSREDISREIAGRMFGNLIRARDFDDARAFHSRFSDMSLEPVPEIIDLYSGEPSSNSQTAWQVSEDGGSISREKIPFDGPQIVVFTSLDCAHSMRFMSELPSHDKLTEIFNKHAIWIEPPDNDLQIKAVADWNRKRPNQALRFMHSFSEWPEYDDWSTPAFYFVENGKIVKSFSGWPNWNEVIKGVESLGLTEANEIQPPDGAVENRD